jgi:predicted nucleic acid-binding protein
MKPLPIKPLELVQQFAHSHSLYFADTLIAATAIHYVQSLITANDKHYAAIPELSITPGLNYSSTFPMQRIGD